MLAKESRFEAGGATHTPTVQQLIERKRRARRAAHARAPLL